MDYISKLTHNGFYIAVQRKHLMNGDFKKHWEWAKDHDGQNTTLFSRNADKFRSEFVSKGVDKVRDDVLWMMAFLQHISTFGLIDYILNEEKQQHNRRKMKSTQLGFLDVTSDLLNAIVARELTNNQEDRRILSLQSDMYTIGSSIQALAPLGTNKIEGINSYTARNTDILQGYEKMCLDCSTCRYKDRNRLLSVPEGIDALIYASWVILGQQ